MFEHKQATVSFAMFQSTTLIKVWQLTAYIADILVKTAEKY
jgi:hypothetical protein